jgi:hypothetical protein
MSADYSRKPLAQKLGIKKGQTLALLNAPDYYKVLLGQLPDEVVVTRGLHHKLDFIQFFARDRMGLEKEFPRLEANLKPDGMIWVTWPNGSSKVRSDLSEGVVREIGLGNGLVDVKICAVDETWSALKFVRREKDRRFFTS